MPANLTPEYRNAEERLRTAATDAEKLDALREMLSTIPKHKGTEKLQADIKRRISRLNRELQKTRKSGRGPQLDHVPKEGAGQVVLVGAPNAGKSSFLEAVTNARATVADFPFSTFKPQPAMMPFEDIQIQLVDLPPVSAEYMESWVPAIIRLADLALLLVDLSTPDPAEEALIVMEVLETHKVRLIGQPDESRDQAPLHLKKTVIMGTKCDVEGSTEGLQSLRDLYGEEFPIFCLSVHTGEGLEAAKRAIFDALGIVRVYTKVTGKKPDLDQPYVLPKGSTVLDVAVAIHREFADKMRYARIWGSEKYDGQQVYRGHCVQDGDIIEVHI